MSSNETIERRAAYGNRTIARTKRRPQGIGRTRRYGQTIERDGGFFADTGFATYFDLVQDRLGAGNVVVHYRFDDETPSTTAADASGNSNDATYENGVTLGTTSLLTQGGGTSVEFDGINDYVQLPDPFDFVEKTGVFTVSAWVDLPRDGAAHWIVGNSISSVDAGWGIVWDDRSAFRGLKFTLNSTGSVVNVVVSLPAAGIHHVVATGDGADVEIFVDGVSAGSQPCTFGTSPDVVRNARIGIYPRLGLFPLDGLVDEVTIADVTATAADVAALYDYGTA